MANPKIPVFGKIDCNVTYIDRPGAYGFLADDDGKIAIVETSMGFFLPGGGLENNEDLEATLKREIHEEIGFFVKEARYVTQAEQFHWSKHYGKHFRKIGSFYHVEATPITPRRLQAEHSLVWWEPEQASQRLSQEFQRWATKTAFGT